MIKKTITYTDYNDTKRTEDFYFNLSKAELTEMQLSKKGGLDTYLTRIIKSDDTPEIMSMFKDIIVKSYGVKSDDGRRFIKSEEISNDFLQTEAYSELLLEIMTNANASSEFINGLMPREIVEEIAKKGGTEQMMQEAGVKLPNA